METAQSIDDRLNQRGRTTADVPTSKSKYGSHKSLSATNSTSSLSAEGHRRSHPSLSSRYSTSDSRLSSSVDNVNRPKRGGSRSRRHLPRLDLSLDSNRHSGHDPNSTTESTEDEERTSADECSYSTEDDGDSSLRAGQGLRGDTELEKHKPLNCSINSSGSYVDKAVEELITTERSYVRDLHDVIQVDVLWLLLMYRPLS